MVDIIKNNISDLVSDLLYYSRKEDEDLPLGKIEEMVENKEISIDEMVSIFRTELKKGLEC